MSKKKKEIGASERREAEIRACTVGKTEVLGGPIVLAEYDPEWRSLFEQEAERIRSVLGSRALRVEHVGSTAVPGLAAKPIIDMALEVENSAAEETYVRALEAVGYVLRIREPEWNEHRMFKGPDTNINLHVFSRGCAEVERMILFRDWLRTNKADRELYGRAKRELAKKEWKYVQNYADAKTEVVEEIVKRATAFGTTDKH